MKRKSFSLLLISLCLVHGCSGNNAGRELSGSSATEQLSRGYCPDSIVNEKGQGVTGKYRYGRPVEPQQLADYRARELANCQSLLKAGNTDALATLVAYWNAQQDSGQLVATLEQYTAVGTDPQALGNAGAYLYRAYSRGASGVTRDPSKAFGNLGLAVTHGVSSLELNYAHELEQRGLYRDAFRHYKNIAEAAGAYSRQERCEANLGLAQLYFNGRAGNENWYLGYYFWREGLSLAEGPQWGSCLEDNFSRSPRYSAESARKKFVDSRISMLSSIETRELENAWRDKHRGLPYIASLAFRRPTGAPAQEDLALNAYRGEGWRRWSPLSGPICSMRSYPGSLSWSELFAARSAAIWTIHSRGADRSSRGSAVAVGPRTLLTNCHLINNPTAIALRNGTRSLEADLLASDRDGDRCVLGVGQALIDYVAAARPQHSLQVGEDVAAIGNPKGLDISLSRGIIAQKREKDGRRYLQTDAAISSGSSGGGLFDRAGNLIGITTFTISSGQGLNFAIAIDEFCRP